MGKVRDALDITDEVEKTGWITTDIQARPGYRLYAATTDKIVRDVECGEARVPSGHEKFNREVGKIIQEAAEAAIPGWKRNSSGDFEKSFAGGVYTYIGEREADKAQWLMEQLGFEHIREGNSFIMSADENRKLREESKGLRVVGLAGGLP